MKAWMGTVIMSCLVSVISIAFIFVFGHLKGAVACFSLLSVGSLVYGCWVFSRNQSES